MTEPPQLIGLDNLMLAFLPVSIVVWILYRWTREGPVSVYGLTRMLGQLLVIGYFLTFILESDQLLVVFAVLMVMVTVSSWIALRTIKLRRRELLFYSFVAILLGGGLSLAVSTQLVLNLQPFYSARYLIPLAGMVFASAMNSVSISAERFHSELDRGSDTSSARELALKAALIPITNSLFAVGLVSLPGMMTGQILSGVDPLIAVRYQIMVMCMLFSSAGLSAACFLYFLIRRSARPDQC